MAVNNEDQLIVAPPGEWEVFFFAFLLAVNFMPRISNIRVAGTSSMVF